MDNVISVFVWQCWHFIYSSFFGYSVNCCQQQLSPLVVGAVGLLLKSVVRPLIFLKPLSCRQILKSVTYSQFHIRPLCSQLQTSATWPVLISPATESSWLSWPVWLITYQDGIPTVTNLDTIQAGRLIVETCNVLSVPLQLTSLVTLGLLSQVGSSDPLESPKYKCLVSLDFVKSISRFVFYAIAVSSLFSYSTGCYMSDISPFLQ